MPTSDAAARRLTWLFLGLVIVKAAAYWIGSALARPDDPFSTVVLYRGKDIESFPIMKMLGGFGIGEAGVFEQYNRGVLTERFVPWLLHAALFRTMEPGGFVAADLLVTPLYFVLFVAVLRRCGIGHVVSASAAAVVTCAAITDFGDVLAAAGPFPRFWGLRVPRPFISELFLLIAVLGMVAARHGLLESRPARWAWVAAGAGLGLLLQSDLYSAIALGLGALAVAVWRLLLAGPGERRLLVGGLLTAGGAGAIVSLPGIVQSFHVNPEAIVRLGLYEVSRLQPPFIDTPSWYVWTALVVSAGAGVDRWTRARAPDDGRAAGARAGRAVLLSAAVGALFAMPATSIVTGTAIELYHYRDTFVRMLSLAGLVVALQAVGGVAEGVARRHVRLAAAGRILVAATAAVACAGLAWRHAVAGPARSDHMRSDFEEWAALSDYRAHFVDLVRELERPRYGAGRVLGTFDHQVWAWWVTFRGGYSYLGDACTTNLKTVELERRAAELSRIVGMTRDEYLAFARRRYVMIFWMSCSTFQATRMHAFAPRADYRPADQALIDSTPAYLGFTVALPLSEEARLGRVFEALPDRPDRRLDVIVLTRDASLEAFAPSVADFEPTFENALFRVWVRRNPGPGLE